MEYSILLIELEKLNTKMITGLFKFSEAIAVDGSYYFNPIDTLELIQCIEKLNKQLEGQEGQYTL